jgi:hypothetical protein
MQDLRAAHTHSCVPTLRALTLEEDGSAKVLCFPRPYLIIQNVCPVALRVATHCTYDRIPRSSIKPRECFDSLPGSDIITCISPVIPKQVRRYLAKIPLMGLR